jgi:hypothetical protein
MERVHDSLIAEAVGRVLARPDVRGLADRDLLACDFLIGVDPVFVGLPYVGDPTSPDGRSYRDTAHCAYPIPNRGLDEVTVVLPDEDDRHPAVAHHELGHVLHWRLRERLGYWVVLPPVCEWAKTNVREAFACAFHSWGFRPRTAEESGFSWIGYERSSREFFDRLLRGE